MHISFQHNYLNSVWKQETTSFLTYSKNKHISLWKKKVHTYCSTSAVSPVTRPPYAFYIYIYIYFVFWEMPNINASILALVGFWSDESWLDWLLCNGQINKTSPQKLLVYYKCKGAHSAVLITGTWYEGKQKLPDSGILSRKQFLWELSILNKRNTWFLNIALSQFCCPLLNKRGSRKEYQ